MNDGKWQTQIKKGLLELCILNLLAQESMYGYQLVKRLTTIPELIITEGTIYPLLSRLKREKVIKSFFEESPYGPARRIYKLSTSGIKHMQEMNRIWKEVSENVNKIIMPNIT